MYGPGKEKVRVGIKKVQLEDIAKSPIPSLLHRLVVFPFLKLHFDMWRAVLQGDRTGQGCTTASGGTIPA